MGNWSEVDDVDGGDRDRMSSVRSESGNQAIVFTAMVILRNL